MPGLEGRLAESKIGHAGRGQGGAGEPSKNSARADVDTIWRSIRARLLAWWRSIVNDLGRFTPSEQISGVEHEMSGEEEFDRIARGLWGGTLGQAVHLDVEKLRQAIEVLAQQIEGGQDVNLKLATSIGFLTAEIAGLSTKLDAKASQASVDDLKAQMTTNFTTVGRKLDVIIGKGKNISPT